MIPCENLHPSLARHYFLHTKVWKVFKHIVHYCTHRKFQLCTIIAIVQVKIGWSRLAHKAHKYRHKICKFGPLTGMIPQIFSCNLFAVILSDQPHCKIVRTIISKFGPAPGICASYTALQQVSVFSLDIVSVTGTFREENVAFDLDTSKYRYIHQLQVDGADPTISSAKLFCQKKKIYYFSYAFAGCLKMLFSHAQ